MYTEFTPTEAQALRDLLAATQGVTLLTSGTLNAQLQAANTSWRSSADWQSILIVGTTLNVERRGKYSYVECRGASASGSITSIVSIGLYPFGDGDELIIHPKLGFQVDLLLSTQAAGIRAHDPSSYANYVMVGGSWLVKASNPSLARIEVHGPERVSLTTSQLAIFGDAVGVKYLTAETPAGGSVTIGTSGVSGTVSAFVDEGAGQIFLGEYAYTGSPTLSSVAAGLADAINALYATGDHSYQALATVAVVAITPPQGLGSMASNYTLSTTDLGDCVSVAAGFGVVNGGTDGVDGVEANGTVNEIITPAIDGTVVTIINEMLGNTLTLSSTTPGSFATTPGSFATTPGSFATSKVMAAKTAARCIYSSALARWVHFS